MKDRIFEKSIMLFGEKGFKETSIQDIVDALEVTKGTFYYYFTSKEEVLMEIHLHYINKLLEKQKDILQDSSKQWKTKLYDLVYITIQGIEREGLSAKVFFREMKHLKDENLEKIVQKRDEFRLHFQTVLEEGVRAGEFKQDLDVSVTTLAILGMTNWSYFWFEPGGRLNEEGVSTVFLKLILEGIESSVPS
ncbi:TetR/AcrR family transcriptional regulator [Priestia koreensis]|uniref:TetR/AcrR family transcriptional regulator n=1 Tax=Priestia koreensis TaxID=284581 RepID=UPI001F57E6EE|nr:TetR/AcrR family transcriptional regulator [Priestia koreensis]MCM3005346.1 TetR/AcrR family transcriptional regulator [Priestia koreensis]UNL86560.1 TetR family transcriptional regulator [Priestia koreensis]